MSESTLARRGPMFRMMAVVLAFSVVFSAVSASSSTPTAKANDAPSVTLGVWSILAMILESLLIEHTQVDLSGVYEGGPGYVDMVGQPCDPDCDEARWNVSVRSFENELRENMTTQRIVIPKTSVEKPVIRNAVSRDTAYAQSKSESAEKTLMSAYSSHVRGLSEAESEAFQDELWDRYSQMHETPVLGMSQNADLWDTSINHPISLIGETPWELYGNSIISKQNSDSGEYEPVRDDRGNMMRYVSTYEQADGDVVVFYHSIPKDLENSFQNTGPSRNNPYGGLTANMDRDSLRMAVVPAAEKNTITSLSGELVDNDVEQEIIDFYTILADMLDLPYDGTLSTGVDSWLYGDLVLPKETSPIDTYEVTGETSTLIPNRAEGEKPVDPTESWTTGAKFPDRVGENGSVDPTDYNTDSKALSYTVSEVGDHWVMDVFVPPSQTTFELAAKKKPDAIESGEKYVAAQAYTAQSCTRWGGDPEWNCQDLIKYDQWGGFPWAKGGTTAALHDDQRWLNSDTGDGLVGDLVMDDGVVRGSLDFTDEQVAAWDADPDLALRGVFGNQQCMVTRPTEDPNNMSALAGSYLPSDLNFRFAGQETNNVGPDNPMSIRGFVTDIPMRGANTGVPFSNGEDGCDQAAVPLACEADEEIPSTPPSTEPTGPTTEPPISDPTSSEPPTVPSSPTTGPTSGPATTPTVPTTGPTSGTTPSTPSRSSTPTGPGVNTTPPAVPGTRPSGPGSTPVAPAPRLNAPVNEVTEPISDEVGPVVDTGGTVAPNWLDRLVGAL